MTVNVGTIDRILRAVAGIVLLALGLMSFSGGLQIGAIIVGIVLLATAGMRFCPAYRLLGVKTCQM